MYSNDALVLEWGESYLRRRSFDDRMDLVGVGFLPRNDEARRESDLGGATITRLLSFILRVWLKARSQAVMQWCWGGSSRDSIRKTRYTE